MPKWDIYLITNTVTALSYVGITTRGIQHRWKQHINDAIKYRYGAPLHAAIRLYGADAFSLRIVCTCDTASDATGREKALISEYRTYKPNGYNATLGGQGYAGPHKAFSPATLQKMREAKLGRPLPESQRQAIGDAHRGRKQSAEWVEKRALHRRGKTNPPITDETRTKLSAALRGHTVADSTRQKISAANKGKTRAKEIRDAMSLQRMGKPSPRNTAAKSGLRGAYKSGVTWFSHIKINGVKRYLGSFRTPEEAHAAYCSAALIAFGPDARFD